MAIEEKITQAVQRYVLDFDDCGLRPTNTALKRLGQAFQGLSTEPLQQLANCTGRPTNDVVQAASSSLGKVTHK